MEIKDIELKYVSNAKFDKETGLFDISNKEEVANMLIKVDSQPFHFSLPVEQANYFMKFINSLYEKRKINETSEKKKIVFAISAAHTMPSSFVKYLEDFAEYNRKFFDIKVFVEVSYIIDEARNLLIEKAKAMIERPDYVFFIDADNCFKANTLIKLVEADKDVIFGVYYQRNKPHFPVMFRNAPDEKGVQIARFHTEYHGDAIEEIDYCGAGCLLVKMEVLEKLEYPYMYIYRNLASKSTVGEDIVFCQKIKNAGFKIYAHTGVDVGHIGGSNINKIDWMRSVDNKDYVPNIQTNIIDFENKVKEFEKTIQRSDENVR